VNITMASTPVSDSETAGLDRLEGEVLAVGQVVRPHELNDLNDKRADAATEALALYIEYKGQTRKLEKETNWDSLLATLADIDARSKPLIKKISITLEVNDGTGEVIKVQVTGPQAKEVSEQVSEGDRIVGEGIKGEKEFLLEAYDVYKRAAGSGERITTPVEPVEEQGEQTESPELTGEEDGASTEEHTS
jgi:hypothetical protein